MREEPLYTEYSADREYRFEVYRRGRYFEVWIQRKLTDEYMGGDWFGYYDIPDSLHIADQLDRAIAIGRDCLCNIVGSS